MSSLRLVYSNCDEDATAQELEMNAQPKKLLDQM